MVRDRLRGIRSELTAEEMRAATLVGLAAVPAGFLWIAVLGTGSASVVLLAGAVVGALYSGRRTPAHRAGARAGLFAPIPEAVVQTYAGVTGILASALSAEMRLAFGALAAVLGLLFLWVAGAFLCILSSAVTAWLFDHARTRLPGLSSHEGR